MVDTDRIRDGAGDRASQARHSAERVYGQARDAARHAADEAADYAGNAYDQSRRALWEGHEQSVRWPHASLIVAGVVGFGLGLLAAKI